MKEEGGRNKEEGEKRISTERVGEGERKEKGRGVGEKRREGRLWVLRFEHRNPRTLYSKIPCYKNMCEQIFEQ